MRAPSRCQREPCKLTYRWRTPASILNGRSGGPKFNRTSYREGFGTSLVRRIVVDQFGGEVSYDWDIEGLIVRLNMPSERLLAVSDDVVSV